MKVEKSGFLGFVFAALLIAIGLLIYLNFFWESAGQKDDETGRLKELYGAGSPQAGEETPENKRVTLYFESEESETLVPEIREVPVSGPLVNRARQVLIELVKGSTRNYLGVIPPNAKLKQFYITERGIAYVDFTEELSKSLEGGSDDELFTVYGIVNTLTVNFPEIRAVKILVNGREKETLNGHVSLVKPLVKDLKIGTE
jgi:spore germination protein GerM